MHDENAEAPMVKPGTPAPYFDLADSAHSDLSLDDLAGGAIVLVFHVADWHPVADEQLRQLEDLRPAIERLGATIVGISVDATWSHEAYRGALGLGFPLLADDRPPGDVARAYGVHSAASGRSRRAVVVIDPGGMVRWASVFPDAIDPGVDGILAELEAMHGLPEG